MELDYIIFALICSLINTIVLYRYFNYIFNKKIINRKIEFASYLIYWLLNNALYFFISVPIVNVIYNLSAFCLLTINYRAHWKKKIFSAIFFYMTLTLVEGMVVFITSKFVIGFFDSNSYNLIVGQVFTSVFAYTFTEILIRKKNVTKDVNLPLSSVLGLLVTPICSFIIINYMLSIHNENLKGLSLCCLLALCINLAVFYLYDNIIHHMAQQKENEAIILQNRDYHYMLENMKASVDSTRQLKHDLKNHAMAMGSLVNAEKYDDLKDYLKNIFQDVSGTEIDTGNITIDKILNFKIEECKNKKIEFSPMVAIPREINIPYDILTVILGNLLDNAIEATNKVEINRRIRFRLFYEVGFLNLDMENPYCGELQIKNGEYLSTKPASEYHGYGLKNIQKAIDRNGGYMEIETKDQRFIVHVILNTK